jgi:HK97 family phage prohead protease
MSSPEHEIQDETEGRESGLLRRTFAAEVTPGDGRTIDVRIMPYGKQITHDDGLGGVPKGIPYQEEWDYGAFSDQVRAANVGRARHVLVNFEHGDRLIDVVGNGTALREERDALYGSFTLHDDAAGDKALLLVREGIVDGISVEVPPHTLRSSRKAGVVHRMKAHLHGIALTRQPAFENARVLALREEIMLDESLLPLQPDPEVLERLQRLGIELPERYQTIHEEESLDAHGDEPLSQPGS